MGDENTEGPSTTAPRGFSEVINHLSIHKIESLLWFTRMCTVVFTLLYIIPILGANPYTCYQRALISNAATSALRLHQRMPTIQLSRMFLSQLLIEDSCHYLFFSLIFLFAQPMTLVLLPVFLFALLHSASFTLTLLDKFGGRSGFLGTWLVLLLEHQSNNILRLVAFTEIFLMPLTIFSLLSGRSSLVTPFVYYRFLSLRYASRRSPYSRTVFHELRLVTEHYASRPGCPAFLSRLLYKTIGLICQLSPPVPQ
ncbi:integral membrane protein, putative [Ixodes scapularis]|uniref:Integral membrane protein, putative n=1 Tax=Ixodes scapularis TaxID=6945 RepID=B7QBQ0_IXOSC|nr:integral membrane protein, putative [Ixodes scapularis]|eukprot:XP_002412964.1 integral membrane protein, putative [Ixodes scapularis]